MDWLFRRKHNVNSNNAELMSVSDSGALKHNIRQANDCVAVAVPAEHLENVADSKKKACSETGLVERQAAKTNDDAKPIVLRLLIACVSLLYKMVAFVWHYAVLSVQKIFLSSKAPFLLPVCAFILSVFMSSSADKRPNNIDNSVDNSQTKNVSKTSESFSWENTQNAKLENNNIIFFNFGGSTNASEIAEFLNKFLLSLPGNTTSTNVGKLDAGKNFLAYN